MEMDAIPQVGSKAPDFTLVGTGGKKIGLRDFLGKKNLVLYFYPKDATPGCLMEACGFRDAYPHFEEHGTVVLGVSRDGVDSHEKFSSKHRLPFLLLSDPGAEVCSAYGVYGTKSFLGRQFLGIHRTTFVIDSRGTIRGVFPKVKVREHAQEVLQFIRRELA
jgi:thioredoxin-dependent peroxiredoxin